MTKELDTFPGKEKGTINISIKSSDEEIFVQLELDLDFD